MDLFTARLEHVLAHDDAGVLKQRRNPVARSSLRAGIADHNRVQRPVELFAEKERHLLKHILADHARLCITGVLKRLIDHTF
ncbi:MAG TPA: hypothetical protein PKN69_01505 [Candidatus Latescibacteria bacterium]|nr:hypothetical protein [Candidatus Latescibacterota bacterium]